MTDPDPFSGPLASITGRLQKLRENNDHLRFGGITSTEQLNGLFFEIGMLIDLVDELAGTVGKLLCTNRTKADET